MRLVVDLHSHSGYAGGVGDIPLASVAATMKQKGIDVFGSGDCLLPARVDYLKSVLTQQAPGLYTLPQDTSLFALQTEVIFSTKLPGYRNKTVAHHVLLFPDFATIKKVQKLLDKWAMKNTIGRPFIVSNSPQQLQDQLFAIANCHPMLEIIPAHVMTPDGIMGTKNMLNSATEFYGDFWPQITTIETGLSADPPMLEKIPDFAGKTFISNSDCHSAALNRIGREFTVLDVDDISYTGIINALRNNKVQLTAEFNPAEGRYFSSGHRAGRQGHSSTFIVDTYPPSGLCPDCGKQLALGVKERCASLADKTIKPIPRKFLHLIPLIEVIAHAFKVKSVQSRRVVQAYHSLLAPFGSEIALWQCQNLQERLDTLDISQIDSLTKNILAVSQGRFNFNPPGCDGAYGELNINL